ncbi:MAG TPA: ATP-binding cassette domain-containing protein, partial [Candidatus Dormibacteraeota bacterium]|nr:ATP-binding cassette domain-containing protein [Candidatus Dormibacteraeota bacterium]
MLEPLVLRVREGTGERTVRVTAAARIGRATASEIALGDPGVSRLHAQLTQGDASWLLSDAGSRNGTLLNGIRLAPGQHVAVRRGDVVQVGGATLLVDGTGADPVPQPGHGAVAPAAAPPATAPPRSFSWTPPGGMALASPPVAAPTPTWHGRAMPARTSSAQPASAPPLAPRPASAPGVLRVGRAIDNDVAITDARVASYHLDAWWGGTGLVVRDLSGGGTAIEGRRVVEETVSPEAVLVLGGGFVLPARALVERIGVIQHPSGPTQTRPVPPLEHLLAARRIVRRAGGRTILRGIDFAVRRGQFIAVAGASGAGKSTLMNVLNGYDAPDEGTVDVVRDAAGQPDLGYVPQDDIIHRQLTLRDAVVLSALVRSPPRTPRPLVESRADEVLTELGLREHATTRVDRLSGGQRKRASVALELMTRPRLLLLDEPTSGLDPASDRRLIALLAALADSGYGVVLITHTTTNIDACDTVAFIAPGGHLVFWGSPADAREHFAVTNLEEVYERLEDPAFGTPEQWRRRFEESSYAANLEAEVETGMRGFAELRTRAATTRAAAAHAAPANAAPAHAAPALPGPPHAWAPPMASGAPVRLPAPVRAPSVV